MGLGDFIERSANRVRTATTAAGTRARAAQATAPSGGAATSRSIHGQMSDYFEGLKQVRPRPEDFLFLGEAAQLEYQSALQEWGNDYRETAKLLSSLEAESMGLVEMPDGTLRPTDEMSPEELDAIDEYNLQVYNQLLGKAGLEQFSLARQSAADENARRMDEYNLKVDEWKNKMDVEKSGLDRALANLDRWMSGQEVAGADADRIQTARQEATKYGTSRGKTSFSGRDLGGGVSMLAQQGGIGADAPLLNYPGFQEWDPVGDRNASLAAMGFDQTAPLIPESVLGMGDVPGVPTLAGMPSGGGGMLAFPAAPSSVKTPPEIPPWTPGGGGVVGQGGLEDLPGGPTRQLPTGPNGTPPTSSGGLNGFMQRQLARIPQSTIGNYIR